jgi:hypothetical protein
MPENRLYHVADKWALDIPIPNPGLQEWLNGPECKAQLIKITGEIFDLYVNVLPVKKGKLRKGAGTKVKRAGVPGQTERYHGWVINRALSYRPTKGQPYPRFIEYGKANVALPEGYRAIKTKKGLQVRDAKGRIASKKLYYKTGKRTKAGYQLRWAAETVANRRLSAAAALALGGDSGAGTEHHQARPAAPRPPTPQQRSSRATMELTKAPTRRNLTERERADARARREAETRARFNANKKPPAPNRPKPRDRPYNPFYDDPREGDPGVKP